MFPTLKLRVVKAVRMDQLLPSPVRVINDRYDRSLALWMLQHEGFREKWDSAAHLSL